MSESRRYPPSPMRTHQYKNSGISTTSQRLEEIRRKYDTPNRRDLKDIYQNASPVVNEFRKRGKGDLDCSRSSQQMDCSSVSGRSGAIYMKQNIKVQQQDVFRKIKQMKQSLLNKNNEDRIRVTKSIYEAKQTNKNYKETTRNDTKNKLAEVGEHRVESIDKINTKIQHILSCLRENNEKNEIENSKTTLDNSKVHYRDNLTDNRNLDRSFVKNTSSIYQRDKNLGVQSRITKVEGFQLEGGRKDHMKTRSFTNCIKNGGTQSRYEMKNGRKLDDQISKIQEKIQQFEEQKRKLGVQFKPYSYSQSKSTTNLKRSYTVEKFQKPAVKPEPTKITQSHRKYDDIYERKDRNKSQMKSSFESTFNKKTQTNLSTNIQNSQISVQISKVSHHSNENDQSPSFRLKLFPVETQKSSRVSERVSDDGKFNNDQLRKRTDEGIQDRKKKLAYESCRNPRSTIKKLVEKLGKQAQLDEKFRNCKLWFDSDIDAKKWDKLEERLKIKNIVLNKQKLKDKFKITDEENNPFFSVRQTEGSIETLIQAFIQSEQYWNDQISHRFSRQDLSRQDFSQQFLDLERKGYIVLEDLVRFLNMESGTFLRNRDIYLIYKRICGSEKVQFGEMMKIICK